MPRWPKDYMTKTTCPKCHGRKAFHSAFCRKCRVKADALNRNRNGVKFCYACKQTLPLSEFSKNRSRTDGLASECRKCSSKRRKDWDQVEEGRGNFCLCGCTQRVRIVRGKSLKFIKDHVAKKLVLHRTKPYPMGPSNSSWMGDNAKRDSGRARAHRRFELGPCELCSSDGKNRHHRDRNPLNNLKSNIQILCDKCHFKVHIQEYGKYGAIKGEGVFHENRKNPSC
jgi:hypothetical protein